MAQAIAGCDCNTYIIHSAVENTRGATQLRRAQKQTLHDFPRKKALHSRKRRRGFFGRNAAGGGDLVDARRRAVLREVFLLCPHQHCTELFLRAADLDQPVVAQKAPDLAEDQRHGIGGEHAAAHRVKAADRLEHPDVADLHKVFEFRAASAELHGNALHQPRVPTDQLLGGGIVARL